VDVITYNNRNDCGPAAGLLFLVEVPEKAIVPFMVNEFDHVLLYTDLPEIYLENVEKNVKS
jgi:hypothetical protein